jgi:uncharacterized membrane protein HdeD (DUF308 family)
MKWMRYTALGIGIAFGLLFLTLFIGEALLGEPSVPSPSDIVIMLLGPFSLIVATCVAWKYERIGGWWLIIGGIVTTILFSVRLFNTPLRLLATFPTIPFPMLLAGSLWLTHAFKSREQ